MKKILLLLLVCTLSYSYTQASQYRVNDAAIEAAFSTAEVAAFNLSDASSLLNPMGGQAVMAEKNALVAILLDFFLGGLAIHRVYLGGKPILILGYLITCGGIFGIVPLIDLIVLAINFDDIGKFVGNSKFFMW
jgi:TM2 domain-containing membrane protein YozV